MYMYQWLSALTLLQSYSQHYSLFIVHKAYYTWINPLNFGDWSTFSMHN